MTLLSSVTNSCSFCLQNSWPLGALHSLISVNALGLWVTLQGLELGGDCRGSGCLSSTPRPCCNDPARLTQTSHLGTTAAFQWQMEGCRNKGAGLDYCSLKEQPLDQLVCQQAGIPFCWLPLFLLRNIMCQADLLPKHVLETGFLLSLTLSLVLFKQRERVKTWYFQIIHKNIMKIVFLSIWNSFLILLSINPNYINI